MSEERLEQVEQKLDSLISGIFITWYANLGL